MKILSLLSLFIISVSMFSCTSSKKFLERGQYDMAIYKASKKLQKNPFKEKQIMVVEQAYKKANQQDEERINYLRKEGTPDVWDEIFLIYTRMKNRQDKIKALPRLVMKSQKRTIYFDIKNYDEELIAAKRKAAEYFYVHGTQLMNKGGKDNARQAYADFYRVKELYKDFKDVDSWIDKARDMGTSFVLFKVENKSNIIMPRELEEDLLKLTVRDLNRQWISYHNKPVEDYAYDYTIKVSIKEILISPESVKEVIYDESKEVPDGFKYALDDKGNVLKDTAGNDIKVPKTTVITCKVVETLQQKSSRIRGTIDYVNNTNNQLVKSDPIAADGVFEHVSAIAIGNLDALKPETRKRIGILPLPFPNNADMIMRNGDQLKTMVKNIVWNNAHLLD